MSSMSPFAAANTWFTDTDSFPGKPRLQTKYPAESYDARKTLNARVATVAPGSSGRVPEVIVLPSMATVPMKDPATITAPVVG